MANCLWCAGPNPLQFIELMRTHRQGKHRNGCTGANQLFAVHKMAVYTLTGICIHTYSVAHEHEHTEADVVVWINNAVLSQGDMWAMAGSRWPRGALLPVSCAIQLRLTQTQTHIHMSTNTTTISAGISRCNLPQHWPLTNIMPLLAFLWNAEYTPYQKMTRVW